MTEEEITECRVELLEALLKAIEYYGKDVVGLVWVGITANFLKTLNKNDVAELINHLQKK